MSEDKNKNITESRTVTSDSKNTSSAYASSVRSRKPSDAVSDDFFADEDEILALIRKRKSEKESGENAEGTEDAMKDDPGLEKLLADFLPDEAGPEEVPAEEPEVPSDVITEIPIDFSYDKHEDEPAEISEAVPEEPVEVTDEIFGKSADDSSAAMDISAEGPAVLSVTGSFDPASLQVVNSESADHEESHPDEIQNEEAGTAETGELQSDGEQTEPSELEKELAEELAQGPADNKSEKRYGFKPYTRELKAEEIRYLQEAARVAEENAAAAGGNDKMAKVNDKNKKKSNQTGSSKPSRTDKKSKSSGSSGAGKTKKQPDKISSSGGKKPPKKKKKWVGFVRAFIRTIIICGIIACLAAAGYVANIISHAETIHPRNIYDTLDVSTHIYDDNENLIDEIYYTENRQIVSYEQLPENLKNAFIAVEDKTFWTHKGFNFRRIIGAILERFHGGRISGTSTITQQLARNVFLPEDKSVRSIKRKIIEMYYAYEIEQELSKEEIITAYLNTIYLGYGCYGVDTAAKTYFSSDVENLTLEQCAALAALPQAPGSYQLLTTEASDTTVEYKNGVYINDTSQDRRNMILNMMLQQGMITEEEKEAATRPLADFIKPGSTDSATSQSAFKDYLIETVKKDLMNEYGIEEDQAIKIIYTKGLNIYTTMDSQAQKAVTKQFSKKKNFPSTVNGKGTVESACVVVEVGTGEIKAMVGTRQATGQMLFNRAVNPRQPGSSIKPLSVYAPALQKSYEYQKDGKKFKFKKTGYDKQGTSGWGDYITVSSQVTDEKMTVNGKTWPLNVTRSYSGKNTFRTAIQKSINTCSVKILSQIGIEYSMDTLKRFGITSAIDDSSQSVNDLNLAALGLGAMSYGISPLEMAEAYATFPNGGVVNTPVIYTKVEDSSGRTLLEGKSQTTKVLDPGVAWIMTDVLKTVVTKGIAGNAKVKGIEVGGKTGTTDDRYDIWFNGFTPSYSVALWIGTDDNVQMDSASEKAALLWSKVVSNIDRAKEGKYKERPDNVIRAWNGEYYTKGTAPPEPPPEPTPEELKAKAEAEAAKKAQENGTTIVIPIPIPDSKPGN